LGRELEEEDIHVARLWVEEEEEDIHVARLWLEEEDIHVARLWLEEEEEDIHVARLWLEECMQPHTQLGRMLAGQAEIKSNPISLVTYTWLADVNASEANCLCF
jgi:hypothetical protein